MGDRMLTILMYIANGLIVLGILSYLILVYINNKKVTDSDGFNVTKDVLSEYGRVSFGTYPNSTVDLFIKSW